jgi:hypothetical protein
LVADMSPASAIAITVAINTQAADMDILIS